MANAQGLRLVRRSAIEGWVTLILDAPTMAKSLKDDSDGN
jgi:hypothetical protein